MVNVRFSDSDNKIMQCLKCGKLMAVKDIVRETGLTYSDVNNSINNLTNKIPIYEDVSNGVTVYGLL